MGPHLLAKPFLLLLTTVALAISPQSSPHRSATAPEVFGAGVLSDGEVYRGSSGPDVSTFYSSPLRNALPPRLALRYVANAGVLVSIGNVDVLVDAPIRDGIAPYPTSDSVERERLERARPPYDSVDAILITHWHDDHFSAEAVAEHLRHNTNAVVISSPEVVDRVRAIAPDLARARLRGILPEPGRSERIDVNGLPVHALRIRHNPARRLPEQHLGFLIGDAATVLHSGDADPSPDNFTVLKALPQVHVAVVPFWYLLGEANRKLVREVIDPREIVAMHVPPNEAARTREQFGAAGVRATVLDRPGTALEVGRPGD